MANIQDEVFELLTKSEKDDGYEADVSRAGVVLASFMELFDDDMKLSADADELAEFLYTYCRL